MRRSVCALALLASVGTAAAEPARDVVLPAQTEKPAAEPDASRDPRNPDGVVLAQTETPSGEPDAPRNPDEPGVSEAEIDEAARGSSVAPPPGVEIMRIRGRGVRAIETDVPESLTSFGAAEIEALGAQNVAELARIAPNVEVVRGGATQASFFIRGVGLSDFNANAAGAVAILQDGVSLNSPALQLGQIFDVENVEVLHGPQSYGPDRNASAGAIVISSRRPTGDYAASIRSSLGLWDSDSEDTFKGMIQDYEGALEFPLGEFAASRFAFRFHDADPYKTNGCGNAPPPADRAVRASVLDPGDASICGETSLNAIPIGSVSYIPEGLPTRVGNEHRWAARGQLRFQPPESEMDWLLNAHGSSLSEQSVLGQAIGTGPLAFAGTGFGGATRVGYWEPDQKQEWEERCVDQPDCIDNQEQRTAEAEAFGDTLASGRPLDTRPYRGDFDRVGLTTLDTWGGFLRGELGIGDMKFTTQTAYDTYTRSRDSDADFTSEVIFEIDFDDAASQFWQEFRLQGELRDEPLRWDVGAYYLQEQLQSHELTLSANTLGTILREYTQDTYSWAIWAGGAWDFLDDFTLEAGLRYNWEQKRFDYVRSLPGLVDPSPEGSIQSATWQAPTGEINLTYRFNQQASAYAKYSRGFKPGHFNATSARPVDNPPAEPEYLDAFEVGLGGSWFDERFSARAAAFYYLYENYQIFLFTDAPGNAAPVLEVLNAAGANNYGIELDARLEPLAGWAPAWLDGLVLGTRFGWLESRFLDFQNIVDRRTANSPVPVPVTLDFTGNRLPNAPQYKVSGTAEWTFDLGRYGTLIPRYEFAWTDDVAFDANNGQGSLNASGQSSLPDLAIGQPAFWLHNLRLAYRMPTGNVEFAVWARNLGNAVYKTYAFDASEFTGLVINFVGPPRTIGFDVSVAF
jgi:outer membrane receptor protein involved in Fe transport